MRPTAAGVSLHVWSTSPGIGLCVCLQEATRERSTPSCAHCGRSFGRRRPSVPLRRLRKPPRCTNLAPTPLADCCADIVVVVVALFVCLERRARVRAAASCRRCDRAAAGAAPLCQRAAGRFASSRGGWFLLLSVPSTGQESGDERAYLGVGVVSQALQSLQSQLSEARAALKAAESRSAQEQTREKHQHDVLAPVAAGAVLIDDGDADSKQDKHAAAASAEPSSPPATKRAAAQAERGSGASPASEPDTPAFQRSNLDRVLASARRVRHTLHLASPGSPGSPQPPLEEEGEAEGDDDADGSQQRRQQQADRSSPPASSRDTPVRQLKMSPDSSPVQASSRLQQVLGSVPLPAPSAAAGT